MEKKPDTGPLGERRSPSADAAWRAQVARDLALAPVERVRKALELGRRMRELAGGEPERR